MNNIQVIYTCPCKENFTYASKASYNQHFKSNRHILYTKQTEEIDSRKKIHNLEIEVSKLKRETEIWKTKYLELSLKYETINFL